MISRIIDSWAGWPTWAKWASGIAAVVVAQAAITAAGERDFLTGFIEEVVAVVLHYGIILGGLAFAIWLGMTVASRTSKNWLGWVAGGVIFLGVSFVNEITTSIPGVGWRIEAMGRCTTDWDGRTNHTDCD